MESNIDSGNISTYNPFCCLTCVANHLARYHAVATSGAEDLATHTTVVAPPEGCELLLTFIALTAHTVRQPVLLEVRVLVLLGRLQGMEMHYCKTLNI